MSKTSLKPIPQFLYHGTNECHLQDIISSGLQPRASTGTSQWEHTVESRSDMVYLTTAYPLHFAANAEGEGAPIIVEIDTSFLQSVKLVADEDALALTKDAGDTAGMSVQERVEYFKKCSHEYPAEISLKLLGNCAYHGNIPIEAISRIIKIQVKDAVALIVGGFDPVIAPMNYKFLGREYEQGVQWLMGNVEVWEGNPRLVRPNIEVLFKK